MSEMIYQAIRYAADGRQGEPSDGEEICFGTLEECRAAIRDRIGTDNKWGGVGDDIEAYHDNEEDGCGGYSIIRVRM